MIPCCGRSGRKESDPLVPPRSVRLADPLGLIKQGPQAGPQKDARRGARPAQPRPLEMSFVDDFQQGSARLGGALGAGSWQARGGPLPVKPTCFPAARSSPTRVFDHGAAKTRPSG